MQQSDSGLSSRLDSVESAVSEMPDVDTRLTNVERELSKQSSIHHVNGGNFTQFVYDNFMGGGAEIYFCGHVTEVHLILTIGADITIQPGTTGYVYIPLFDNKEYYDPVEKVNNKGIYTTTVFTQKGKGLILDIFNHDMYLRGIESGSLSLSNGDELRIAFQFLNSYVYEEVE